MALRINGESVKIIYWNFLLLLPAQALNVLGSVVIDTFRYAVNLF